MYRLRHHHFQGTVDRCAFRVLMITQVGNPCTTFILPRMKQNNALVAGRSELLNVIYPRRKVAAYYCVSLPRESTRVAWGPAQRRDGRLSCVFIASRGTGTLTSGGSGTSTVGSSATCSGIVTSNVHPIVTSNCDRRNIYAPSSSLNKRPGTVCHDWVYH